MEKFKGMAMRGSVADKTPQEEEIERKLAQAVKEAKFKKLQEKIIR